MCVVCERVFFGSVEDKLHTQYTTCLDTQKQQHKQKEISTLVVYKNVTRGLVSKETVALRRWGRKTQNFGFDSSTDNVNWPL